MKTKTTSLAEKKKQERPFGQEIIGHVYEGEWYEIHQRSKEGKGEW